MIHFLVENYPQSNKRCVWIDWAEQKAPKCVYKDNTGYTVIGDIQHNGNTYIANLRRKGLSKVFDQDVHEMMKVEVEMYNDYALRIHVRI
ncbi:hypothetical protein KUTeg_011534 [Tegillarca granosa]|uniref:Uncharacterized protein n=1 Tax=Tegillarca granosa TaxID=220873 RepID=A0ABQ9EWV6_TEGGR|nr:hypothetical protein KUTeg_011534 [Tegillarca granosa]